MSQHESGSDTQSSTGELTFQIEEREFQSDLCTIYDPAMEDHERMRTWITAREGSYVSLRERR